jgi:SPP1 gp7 family putative phage head morphogenesis protein
LARYAEVIRWVRHAADKAPDVRHDINMSAEMAASIANARKRLQEVYDTIAFEQMSRDIFGAVDERARKSIAAQLGLSPDELPESPLKQQWLENQRRLGKQAALDFTDGVEKVLEDAPTGIVIGELADELEGRLGVAASRADLIATDSVLKLNANLNETRQRSVGIDRYVWRTSVDERVRAWHVELDGTEHSWADPPLGGGTGAEDYGHPGSGIRCRCTAEAVIPEFEDSALDLLG